VAIIYTHNRSAKKKPSKKTLRLREERSAYFASIKNTVDAPDRSMYLPAPLVKKSLPPLSNSVGNGFKRSVEDYKWKRDREESVATAKAIEEKKKRLAPSFNKGPVQYITDGADVETLGRKM
jgi:hypothetical protein